MNTKKNLFIQYKIVSISRTEISKIEFLKTIVLKAREIIYSIPNHSNEFNTILERNHILNTIAEEYSIKSEIKALTILSEITPRLDHSIIQSTLTEIRHTVFQSIINEADWILNNNHLYDTTNSNPTVLYDDNFKQKIKHELKELARTTFEKVLQELGLYYNLISQNEILLMSFAKDKLAEYILSASKKYAHKIGLIITQTIPEEIITNIIEGVKDEHGILEAQKSKIPRTNYSTTITNISNSDSSDSRITLASTEEYEVDSLMTEEQLLRFFRF